MFKKCFVLLDDFSTAIYKIYNNFGDTSRLWRDPDFKNLTECLISHYQECTGASNYVI